MGESLDATKGSLESALILLDAIPSGGMSSDELRDIRIKIQMGLNALIQNEKAIWLKTKKGRDILGEFQEASAKLMDAVERLKGGTSPAFLDGVKTALVDVEAGAKKLNEETRRRSMVVT
jgi:hypothetical protein